MSEVRSCKSCTYTKTSISLSRARARVEDRNERRSDRARVLSVWRRLEENCVEEEEEERDGGQCGTWWRGGVADATLFMYSMTNAYIQHHMKKRHPVQLMAPLMEL